MTARPLWGVAFALALLVAPSLTKKRPVLVSNASASVPIGLYWVGQDAPGRGDLAVVQLPTRIAPLATEKGYIPRTACLLKPVAAVSGDRVCRFGAHVLIRGTLTARTLPMDSRSRPLPRWQGYRMLGARELFLLTPGKLRQPHFGPIQLKHVLGRATLIFRPF